MAKETKFELSLSSGITNSARACKMDENYKRFASVTDLLGLVEFPEDRKELAKLIIDYVNYEDSATFTEERLITRIAECVHKVYVFAKNAKNEYELSTEEFDG